MMSALGQEELRALYPRAPAAGVVSFESSERDVPKPCVINGSATASGRRAFA